MSLINRIMLLVNRIMLLSNKTMPLTCRMMPLISRIMQMWRGARGLNEATTEENRLLGEAWTERRVMEAKT